MTPQQKRGVKQVKYNVIRDTREQQGWIFEATPYCTGTTIKTMKTGDYTLEGLENFFCVERKKNVSEFAKNILEARFERELVRLEVYPHAYIVCEFSLEDIMKWPLNSGIPKHKLPYVKITKQFILKRFLDIQTQYKVKFIMAGPYGKEVMSSLFKRVSSLYESEIIKRPVQTKVNRKKSKGNT